MPLTLADLPVEVGAHILSYIVEVHNGVMLNVHTGHDGKTNKVVVKSTIADRPAHTRVMRALCDVYGSEWQKCMEKRTHGGGAITITTLVQPSLTALGVGISTRGMRMCNQCYHTSRMLSFGVCVRPRAFACAWSGGRAWVAALP